jgi:hypothetical protein
MKNSILTLLCFFACAVLAQGQRIESTSSCGVTVYTDNGAYVKAKNSSSAAQQCEFTYTERYTKDGKTYEVESTYKFGIAANEERQLFFSQNAVVKISITKCQSANSNGEGSGGRNRRPRG